MVAGSDDEDVFLAVIYDDRSPEEKACVPVEHRELSRYQVVRESLLAGEYGVPPLPELVVDKIIDDARYWNWVSKETRAYKAVMESRKPYLSIEVPAECHQVKIVVMECQSTDQGWSNYPIDKTIRQDFWTWGDLSVQSSEAVEEFKLDDVYTNNLQLYTIGNWNEHRKEYGVLDQLVQRLTPGKRLVLSLNAMFPGWVNFVRYAKLTVYFM